MVAYDNSTNHHGASAQCQRPCLPYILCTFACNWHPHWLCSSLHYSKKGKTKRSDNTFNIHHSIHPPKAPIALTSNNSCHCCCYRPSHRSSNQEKGINNHTNKPKWSTINPTRTPQSPPEADFSSCWLRIDLPRPTPNTSQYSHKDILLALQTFSFAAWQINQLISFFPIFEASKYPPLTNTSNFPTSVYTLKHYLKNSTIASLLKGNPSDQSTLRARVNTRISIPITSLLQQISSAHPHYKTIVDPFDGMLPIPCGWLLFPSAFVQRLTLANQLNHIFKAETEIDTPFLCIWANIYGIGDFKKTTAPAIQIKCHPSHKTAIQALLLTLISPSAIDTQDPRYIFQRRMVFLSPDMLTITDADYASLICDQYEFQASETTLKVTGLQPLSTIITGSTNTLGTALTDIPDPTVCNYLFCSIETTTSFSTSTYLLCFSRQFTLYTTNLIKSLFPTLSLLYPTLQITDVWENPSNHPTKETIAELLAHSKLHL